MFHDNIVRIGIGCIAAATVALSAQAAVIDVPPVGLGNTIAANDTVLNNIWTGEAQSFTAQDPNIQFGFWMFEQSQVPTGLLFSLYSGDGVFTTLLAQRAATLNSGTIANPTLVTVDFSAINLVPNSKYTVAVTLPSQGLPPLGTYSNASVMLGGSNATGNPNPYSGGSFYYVGSAYNPAFFLDRDIAFRVTPIPEPSTLAMMCTAALLYAGWRTGKRVKLHDAA